MVIIRSDAIRRCSRIWDSLAACTAVCMHHSSFSNLAGFSNLARSSRSWPVAAATSPTEPSFHYFAYGSCMCPVDLKRTLGEPTHSYVIGHATLKDYRLRFSRRSLRRNCGALDVVPEVGKTVEGVLYQLPWRLSDRLDEREEVPKGGYRQEMIEVWVQGQHYAKVRTYVVIDKLPEELAPNDWYFNVVMRGAVTCGLPEHYCWQLFDHMHNLQRQAQQASTAIECGCPHQSSNTANTALGSS